MNQGTRNNNNNTGNNNNGRNTNNNNGNKSNGNQSRGTGNAGGVRQTQNQEIEAQCGREDSNTFGSGRRTVTFRDEQNGYGNNNKRESSGYGWFNNTSGSNNNGAYNLPNKSRKTNDGNRENEYNRRPEENPLGSSDNYVGLTGTALALYSTVAEEAAKQGSMALPTCAPQQTWKRVETLTPLMSKKGTSGYEEFYAKCGEFLSRNPESEVVERCSGIVCFGNQNTQNYDGVFEVQCGETTDYGNEYDIEQAFPKAAAIKRSVRAKNLPFFQGMSDRALDMMSIFAAVDPPITKFEFA